MWRWKIILTNGKDQRQGPHGKDRTAIHFSDLQDQKDAEAEALLERPGWQVIQVDGKRSSK